jgi:excisionase family DNA binding protein
MSTQATELQSILNNPDLAGKLTFQLSGPDLVNAIQQAAETINENRGEKITAEEKYLTPDQASEMLQVSKVTLWNWKRTGILTAFKIGRQVRYKLSDIQRIAEGKEANHE